MTQLMEQTDRISRTSSALERQPAAPALQRLRKAAIARFAELGFPGPRDEEWRFTPLAPLVQTPFRCPAHARGADGLCRSLRRRRRAPSSSTAAAPCLSIGVGRCPPA